MACKATGSRESCLISERRSLGPYTRVPFPVHKNEMEYTYTHIIYVYVCYIHTRYRHSLSLSRSLFPRRRLVILHYPFRTLYTTILIIYIYIYYVCVKYTPTFARTCTTLTRPAASELLLSRRTCLHGQAFSVININGRTAANDCNNDSNRTAVGLGRSNTETRNTYIPHFISHNHASALMKTVIAKQYASIRSNAFDCRINVKLSSVYIYSAVYILLCSCSFWSSNPPTSSRCFKRKIPIVYQRIKRQFPMLRTPQYTSSTVRVHGSFRDRVSYPFSYSPKAAANRLFYRGKSRSNEKVVHRKIGMLHATLFSSACAL